MPVPHQWEAQTLGTQAPDEPTDDTRWPRAHGELGEHVGELADSSSACMACSEASSDAASRRCGGVVTVDSPHARFTRPPASMNIVFPRVNVF